MKKDSFLKIFGEKNQHKIVTAVFVLFAVMVFGRLSVFTDYIFSKLGLDLFNRLSTKIVWIAFYIAFVLIISFILAKYLGRTKTLISEFLQKRRNSLIVFGIFLLSLIVTLPFAFMKSEAISGIAYYILLVSIPVFLWFVLEGVEKHIFTKALLTTINVVSWILAFVTVVQYLAYNNGGTQNWIIRIFDRYGGFMPISFFTFADGAGSILRPSSLMVDPNFLAVFLASLIMFSIDFIVKKYKNEKRLDWYSLFALILNVSNLLISGSRTGILVLAVEIIVYILALIILNILRNKHKIPTGKILVAGVFGNFFTRFSDAINLRDSSSLQHLEFAKSALEMFKQKPITGVGIANYPYYYWEIIDKNSGFATPHSVYFQFIAEVGIIGTTGLFVLIGYVLKQILRSRNIVYLAIFAGILVGNITYDYFMTPWVWFYIGLFLL